MKYLLWAGTEDSLVTVSKKMESLPEIKANSGDDAFDSSSLLTVHGNVGVISIRGPLVNTDAWYNSLIGVVSYNEISNALVEAAELPGVHSILLDIDSPGGMVSGVADTADLISYVDSSIKPVYTYTSGTLCSGAYWLGSSAREIFASRVANIGSIGVITTSFDVSQQLEKEGISATVIRAGKYKQMGNPYEPLTEEGKSQIQQMVDDVYKIFVSDVSTRRGRSYQYTDEYMAQGRVMLSESAKTVGLIDEVMTFDQALITISKKTLDKRSLPLEHNNNLGATMSHKKKSLVGAVYNDLMQASAEPVTEPQVKPIEDVAVTNAKVSDLTVSKLNIEKPETIKVTEDEVSEVTATETEDPNIVVLEDGTVVSLTDQEVEVVEDTELEVSEPKAQEESPATLTVLFDQIRERDEKYYALRSEFDKAKEKLAAFEAMEESLKNIVAKSTQGMQTALGQPRTDFTQSNLKTVVEAHASVSATFHSSFKAGQQSVSSAQTEKSPNETKDKPKSFHEMTAMQRANASSL